MCLAVGKNLFSRPLTMNGRQWSQILNENDCKERVRFKNINFAIEQRC